MSFVALLALCSTLSIPSNAYTDIIDSIEPNEYHNQQIKCSGNGDCKIICDAENSCFESSIVCPRHFLCDITCSGTHSCALATILCPYGQSCTVNCNNQTSCQSTTIYAQYSSYFKLNDCSTGDLSCNGITIYFPPNHNTPRALINGGNHLSAMHFYAIFGWLDIQIINYYGNLKDNTNAYMHCLPDYSETCIVALDSWSCQQINDTCNDPPTQQPTTSPTSSPTLQPTKDPTSQPTFIPTLDPTIHPTYQPTFIPTKHPTLDPTITFTIDTTIDDINNSVLWIMDQVDVLWIITAVLLSILCCILIVLSYYIYPARLKECDQEQQRKSSAMNELILAALNENKNNKYDNKEGNNDVYNQHTMTTSIHVRNNPLWNEEPSQTVQCRSQPQSKIYPNGNLNRLHENSYSHSARYHYSLQHRQSSVPSMNTGFPHLNKQFLSRHRSEPVYDESVSSSALKHHLNAQQRSESLFNLQQQRLQTNGNHGMIVFEDINDVEMNMKSSKAHHKENYNETKRSVMSVELASKMLSPLSSLTASSMVYSERVLSDDDQKDHGFPMTQAHVYIESTQRTPTSTTSSSSESTSTASSSSDDELKHDTESVDYSQDMEHLYHERNETVVVKETPGERRRPRVSITIGNVQCYESPFNDDNDKTVWTQTDCKKLDDSLAVECPISIDDNEDSKSMNEIRNALEIHGLINL